MYEENIFEKVNPTVTISLDEYVRLTGRAEEAVLLARAIWKEASISWDGKSLSFHDDLLEPLMYILHPDEYTATLTKLKAERDEAVEELERSKNDE